MSFPQDQLQKVLGEMQNQVLQSQQDINTVKMQIAAKQREVRMLDLTSTEVSSLSRDNKLYEGIGKMFVFSPLGQVTSRIGKEKSVLQSDIENMNKRLQHLEITHKNTTAHMSQILGGR